MCSRPLQNVKLDISRRSRAVTAEKCSKKRDARAKLLSQLIANLIQTMQSRRKHFDYLSFSSAELCGSAKDNILRSPVYVQSYPPNMHCVYNISVPHGKVQKLVFQIFELAFDPECRLE